MSVRRAVDRPVTHVCFHGVGRPRRELEPGEAPYWIGHAPFLRILDELVGRDDVELSFDDGNISDLELAAPALRERGLVATFFVLAGRLSSAGSLSISAVNELCDAGMPIGNHGMHHVPWVKLDRRRSEEELARAREKLQDVSGTAVRAAALPLGRYDRRTLVQLRELDYERVLSSDRVQADPARWFQPRFSVHDGDDADSVRDFFVPLQGPRRLARRAVLLAKRLR